MQNTTPIKRRLDYQGRVTLPKQFVNTLQLEPEDEVNITFDGQYIQITPTRMYCVFCGKEATDTFQFKPICTECIARLRNN